jgi:Phage integrase, N-terminal
MSISKLKHCCRDSLQRIITANIKTNVDGSVSSHATRNKYANSLHKSFRELETLGFKLSDAKNLKGKHLVALGKHLEQQAIAGKLKPSTIDHPGQVFDATGLCPLDRQGRHGRGHPSVCRPGAGPTVKHLYP